MCRESVEHSKSCCSG